MICGAGLLEGATVFSFEQLIKDCEIYEMLHAFSSGITVTPEMLAVDAIHQVGPQNHFMLAEHTLKHMRAIWQPTVKGCQPTTDNQDHGISQSDAVAAEKARDILKNHHPTPPDNIEQLQEILNAYERMASEKS